MNGKLYEKFKNRFPFLFCLTNSSRKLMHTNRRESAIQMVRQANRDVLRMRFVWPIFQGLGKSFAWAQTIYHPTLMYFTHFNLLHKIIPRWFINGVDASDNIHLSNREITRIHWLTEPFLMFEMKNTAKKRLLEQKLLAFLHYAFPLTFILLFFYSLSESNDFCRTVGSELSIHAWLFQKNTLQILGRLE